MTALIEKEYKPFIKWVGGKRGLLEQLLPLFPKNFNNYHEPFVGGGAVFFELYSENLLSGKKIILSDINKDLVTTYKVIQSNPTNLIDNLKNYKEQHSKEFYYKVREVDRKEYYNNLSDLEKATRFIYLNKTCFNGLYRVNKNGFFNTPIGSYKNPNIADRETILNASLALQDALILEQSFEKVLDNAKKGDFIYFDPPYYPLNKTSNFTSYDSNCFLEEEQIKLFEVFKELDKIGCLVALSNSDTNFIKELYKEYDINIVNANRFINSKSSGRGKINEVLVRNYR
jgi:DNA adenine methylase